jgi:serine/threonine-protein kinase RsbW
LTIDTCKTATFPGRFASLAAIADFVSPAVEAAGFDARAVYSVTMAVDEACTNIIEHAYQGEGRGPIECTYQIGEDRLTVILRDFGTPFDPTAVPPPDLESSLQDRDVGGLGVHFMRNLMDSITFEFTEFGNVLTMVKYRETAR